jgi:nitrile hydratase
MLASVRAKSATQKVMIMAERLITDIGGQPDGPVPREEVPQLFWEKHMIAMFNVLWSKGVFNLDEFRRMVEQTPPEEYKKSTFYGRRVDGMADLLIEKGIVDEKELGARTQRILASGTRDHVR